MTYEKGPKMSFLDKFDALYSNWFEATQTISILVMTRALYNNPSEHDRVCAYIKTSPYVTVCAGFPTAHSA